MNTRKNTAHILAFSLIVCLFLCCNCSAEESSKSQKSHTKATSNSGFFKVISASWTNYARSPMKYMSWADEDEDKGLIVIVKRPTDDSLNVHSNDFALAFEESDTDIPRRPCVGISYGMKYPTEEIRWGVLGLVSRQRINQGQPYFALLFGAPKNIKTFTLLKASLVGSAFVVK